MFYLIIAIAAIICAVEVKYNTMKKLRVNISPRPSQEEIYVDIRLNIEQFCTLKYKSMYECIIENCENAERELGDKYDGERMDAIIESIILKYYSLRETEDGNLDSENNDR